MPNADSLAALAQGSLIQTVDTARPAGDRFKFSAAFRTEFDARLADLHAKNNATALTESNRAGGSAKARTALTTLERLLHDGYNGIKALPSFKISDDQRLEVFTAYGWAGGMLGEFNDGRTLGLARLAEADDLDLENPAWGYDAELKTALAAQLAIFDANADDRTAGERMGANKARNKALALFNLSLSRARHLLCGASDDLDQSPELRRAGFKVRKDRAPKAATPPKPEA